MATTIAELVVKIGADIKGFQNATKQMENEFSGIVNAGNKMKAIGGTLTTYVTAPILAAAGASIKMAADVDKGVSEVITLFGLTGTEATAMSKKMKEGIAGVSNEVGIAQTVITEGLYNAISAGIPEENVFDFMTIAAQASIAGVTDVNTAVDGITTAINAYGLSAEDAQRVSDSMFAAVQGGKTTFGELSDALFNVAPAAAAAGVSMEEVNAGIATLTASGVPTSVATTQLRAALTGLQRPSEDLDKIFQKLGYESAQVAIESKGLGFALDAVKTASNGNNGELQKLLGSTEAVSAANIIAGTGAEKFATELDRQANAAGATQKAFDVMQKSTAQQFQKTTTMLQNIAIALGDKLLPLFNDFLGVIQDVLMWFDGLSDTWQNAILIIAGIAAAVGPVLIVLGKLATLMPAIVTGFTILTGPIGWTIAAITALGAAVYYIYDNWEGLTQWFSDLWFKIKMVHLVMAKEILGIVENLFGWIPGSEALFAGLSSTINNAIDGAKIEREAQLAERAVNAAARQTEALSTEAVQAGTEMQGVGEAGTQAGEQIADGMATAVTGVKSLAEQIAEIMATLGTEMAAGKRELAFLVKLDRPAELRVEIEELEQALKALANDTTINIDDSRVIDLQTSLIMARNELDMLNAADAFKSKLQTAFRDLDMAAANSSEEIRNVVKELNKLRESNSLTGEQSTYLTELILDLQKSAQMAEDAELAFEDMLGMLETDNIELDGLIALYDQLTLIDKTLSGQDALSAKIEAVNKAIEDGSISWAEGQEMIKQYRLEMIALEKEQNSFENRMKRVATESFPNAVAAINSGKAAVTSFKNAFNNDDGKPFLQNIDEGLLQVRDTLNFAKASMNEFGNVAGLALTGLQLLVPGVGAAVGSVLSILNTLGVDVEAILKKMGDALLGIIGIGGGGGGSSAMAVINTMLTGIGMTGQLNTALGSTLFSAENLKSVFGESVDFEDFIQRLVDFAAEFGEVFDFAQIEGAFTAEQIKKIKNLAFPGVYDPETGQRAQVSDELRAQIMAQLATLQARDDLSAQEILELLIAQFGRTALKTLGIAQMLGLPALAQGGMVFGPTMALVGDNMRASSDPEVVSPLSKLNDMLVKPTLAAVSSLMGTGGGTQQVIYVTLDGRVLAESAFYNLPDVVRMHTGGLQ
jgi:TP901 family phage tail tape measure protein